jgi:cyclic pyranopterin phosphate synthase
MVMVDVSGKPEVLREATATGTITLKPETIRLIKDEHVAKGDPVSAAKLAGVLAAKKTDNLIPLCHPLPITNVKIQVKVLNSTVQVTSTVKTNARTGVEMEALVATAVCLLTIWDMVKQYEKDAEGQYLFTSIKDVHVVKKIKEGVSGERKHEET